MPAKDRRRLDEQHALLGEQPSLCVGEAKTLLPAPGLQHAILGAQVLDRLALPATDQAGDQQNEGLKRNAFMSGAPTAVRTTWVPTDSKTRWKRAPNGRVSNQIVPTAWVRMNVAHVCEGGRGGRSVTTQ